MHVTHLSLVDFRSYRTVELELPAGVTTFVGPNGQGKTNLVEAIGYASMLRSHRVASDAPLVRRGADRAVIRVNADCGGRAALVELELNPGRANRARLNRAPVPRPRDVLGQVSRVLFAPEDLTLVKGDPRDRRGYLDELMVALSPRFDAVLSDLDRVLRQRNSLLKSASAVRGQHDRGRAAAEETLAAWDDQLVGLSADVIAGRAALTAMLADPVATAYRSVAPDGRDPHPSIEYVPGVSGAAALSRAELAERIRAELVARRDEEFARGVTLVGPHRDELGLAINGMPIRGYASHGESWSMTLALRLASYDILVRRSGPGREPVLILDDVFAELDADRRTRLAQAVSEVEQVLITAAVPADVPEVLRGRSVAVDELEGV